MIWKQAVAAVIPIVIRRRLGSTEESLAAGRRALDLDPLDLIINVYLGWHYLYSRDYDRHQTIEQVD